MLTKLYRAIERGLITLVLVIIFLILVIIFALTVNSINEAVKSIDHYYRVVDLDEQACIDFGKRVKSKVEWRDDTIFGFGPDDSYGCYLIKE